MGNSLSATLSADTMIGQCYVCSENIETQHDLLVHVRLHQSQLLSLIDLIDVSDSQSTIGNVGASRRQSGVITTQMSRDRSLECQVCKGKKFRRTNDLTRHYATHCRWTDLSLDGHCPSCSAQLRNPSNFLTHQCPGPHDKQRKEKCSSIRSAIDAFYKVPKTNYSQLSQSGELTWPRVRTRAFELRLKRKSRRQQSRHTGRGRSSLCVIFVARRCYWIRTEQDNLGSFHGWALS